MIELNIADSVATVVLNAPQKMNALDEAALHDDAHALLQALGDVLGSVTPHRAVEEHRLAVLPLVAVLVEGARRVGHGEAGDRCAGRAVPEVRVRREVAGDGDVRVHEVS